MFSKIAGTKDILPDQVCQWQAIETIARNTFLLYNYLEIRPPLIEDAALFSRSLGQGTEIVQKQMFLVEREKETYALRPEATASIVRAYIENNLDKSVGFAKLYYIGPMFRLERPQKGRLRQFHHIGCEAIGSTSADLDVEVISLASCLLDNFGVEGYKIKLNSLGCDKDRQAFTEDLKSKVKNNLTKFCDDCQNRFQTNSLRILDCKNQDCRKLIEELKISDSHLCPECKTHFEQVKSGLDALKINYEINPHLVRGLDYYTRTVFEISHPDLGAQDALGAGGRYNNLVKELGGPDVGAIGFAFGVERLLLVTSHKSQVTSQNLVYLITLGEEARKEGMKLLQQIRQADLASDTDYEAKSLKGAMRKANDLKAAYVLIIGDDEIKKGTLTLKNMRSGEQKEIKQIDLIKEIKC